MTVFDPQLASTLDRLHPPVPAPADWRDVLERAERLRRGARRGRPSRRRIGVGAVVAVAALVASLAVTTPWRGGPDFIARALGAIGSARYITATVEPAVPAATDVDLATGRERAVRVAITYWLDSERIEYRSRVFFDGVPVGSETAGPDPALAAFATGYRAALAKGAAHLVGQTTVRRRKARIIRFAITSLYENGTQIQFLGNQPKMWEDVAVDEATYKPLWFRQGGVALDGKPGVGPPSRVVSISATATRPAVPAKDVPLYDGTATTVRTVTAAEAARALGRPPVWSDVRVAGIPLRALLLQRVTSAIYPVVEPPVRTGYGLRLAYGQGGARVEIDEAPVPLGGYGFATATRTSDLGAIPPEGTVRVSRFSGDFTMSAIPSTSTAPPMKWTGQLRSDGLYVTIRATTRALLLEAARSLAPMR